MNRSTDQPVHLSIHIDGGSRGNPGPAAAGVVVRRVDDGDRVSLLHEAGYFLGRLTNNVAEYQGLLRALQLAEQLKAREIALHSDSELMVRQITGQYQVKSPDLKPLFHEAQRRLLKFDVWHIRHVPREENRRADELVNMALDARRDVVAKSVLKSDTAEDAGSSKANAAPAYDADAPGGPCPRWAVVLIDKPGPQCPGAMEAGKPYVFGPYTPEGLCVYAAQAALQEGPLEWDAETHRALSQCPRCGAAMRVERMA